MIGVDTDDDLVMTLETGPRSGVVEPRFMHALAKADTHIDMLHFR